MMKHVPGRVIVKADIEGKNWHTFSHGLKIRIERDFNNLDRKHTQQVLGEVVSAEGVPTGAMILFHHNAIHPVNMILNNSQLSGDDIAAGIRYFSFSESECYLWKEYGEKQWKPMKGFGVALYTYKPYKGNIEGILPEKLDNILYIASGGNFAGKVCNCLKYTGMPIVYVNERGIEETIIRFRTYEEYDTREEIVAVNDEITEMVYNGEILVGTSQKDCKTLKEYYEAN